MPNYILSPEALSDLEDIVDYTAAQWGGQQAFDYLESLENKLVLLDAHPDMGTLRASLHKGIRSFPFEKHIIYYRIEQETMQILRVLHQSMDPKHHRIAN